MLCPKCGSDLRTVNISATLEGKSHLFIGYTLKKEGLKKPVVESIHRLETQKSTGRIMEKSRLIDLENDQYIEHVVDNITRETIHRCEEPLSEHKGHGSAKKKGG